MRTGSRRLVLIVGQRPDPHIDAVCTALEEAGARVVLLDRHAADDFCIRYSPQGIQVRGRVSGREIDLARAGSVWWRVKPAPSSEFPGGSATVEEAFRWREWKAFLRGLAAALPRARWVNPLQAHYRAANKIYQLSLARAVGLDIPETAVTNSPRQALRLFERRRRVVYKTLSSFLIPPDGIVFTNEVTRRQVREEAHAILLAPCIFQECVDKAHELRATVVGDRVVCVRIDSQSAEQTALDWRRDQSREMYSPDGLSRLTQRRLLAFHRRAGLVYGAYDFIVRPDGREVFLECNPGGQWLWLEQATGLSVTRPLAEFLNGR